MSIAGSLRGATDRAESAALFVLRIQGIGHALGQPRNPRETEHPPEEGPGKIDMFESARQGNHSVFSRTAVAQIIGDTRSHPMFFSG